jgi:hypothetical protein
MVMESLVKLLMERSSLEERVEVAFALGAADPCPPFYLDLVLVWRSLSPSWWL